MSQQSNSYQWFFPGGNPSSDTGANPHGICYPDSGTFDVTLIASNSNGSDSLTLSNYITVYPQVQFSPLFQHGDTLFSTPGYALYHWYLDTTLIAGANNYFYVATQSGNYRIVVTDNNGCNATAELINVIASIKDISVIVNDFTAQYSSGNIYLNIISSFTGSSEIILTDALGKKINLKNILLVNGKNGIELTGLNLSSGIYFIKILNSKDVKSCKIFIY